MEIIMTANHTAPIERALTDYEDNPDKYKLFKTATLRRTGEVVAVRFECADHIYGIELPFYSITRCDGFESGELFTLDELTNFTL